MEDWGAVRDRLLHDDFGGGDTPPARQRKRWLDVHAALDRVEQKTKDEQKWYESFHRMMAERDVLRQRVEELERDALSSAPPYYRKWEEAFKRAEAAEAKLAEMAKAIPDTFYAGADLIFRQAQLVRIWGNAVKANAELEAEVERLREIASQAEDEATFLRGQYNEAEEKRSRAEVGVARLRVEKVLALHVKAFEPHCIECVTWCKACMDPWPCPTRRALDGEEE